MNVDFERSDIVRIRMAVQSAMLACKAACKEPGDRLDVEAHELASIESRLIALVEMGQEDTSERKGTRYEVRARAGEATGSGSHVRKRLPGLGG